MMFRNKDRTTVQTISVFTYGKSFTKTLSNTFQNPIWSQGYSILMRLGLWSMMGTIKHQFLGFGEFTLFLWGRTIVYSILAKPLKLPVFPVLTRSVSCKHLCKTGKFLAITISVE